MKSLHFILAASILTIAISPCLGDTSRVEEMKVEIEQLKAKLEEMASGDDPTAKAIENIEVAKEQVEAARTEIEEIEEQLRKSDYLLGIYKNSYRIIPKVSPGTSLGSSVTLSDGSTLQNVVFVGTARGGIKVESSAGPRTISASDFPAGWTQYFNLPPRIADPTGGFANLLSTKPESAWTEEARKAHEQEMALAKVQPEDNGPGEIDSGDGNGGAATSGAGTAGSAPPSGNSDEEARLIRNQKRVKEIYLLRSEYNRLAKAQRDVKRKKYSELEGFRRMKIKKAQAQIDQAMVKYDVEIDRLTKQMDEIQLKITQVNASME